MQDHLAATEITQEDSNKKRDIHIQHEDKIDHVNNEVSCSKSCVPIEQLCTKAAISEIKHNITQHSPVAQGHLTTKDITQECEEGSSEELDIPNKDGSRKDYPVTTDLMELLYANTPLIEPKYSSTKCPLLAQDQLPTKEESHDEHDIQSKDGNTIHDHVNNDLSELLHANVPLIELKYSSMKCPLLAQDNLTTKEIIQECKEESHEEQDIQNKDRDKNR